MLGVAFPRRIAANRQLRRLSRLGIVAVIGLVGLVDMLSLFVPALAAWDILPNAWLGALPVSHPHAHPLTAVIGFFLLMLSYGLARGKRQAWLVTLVLLLLSALLLHHPHGGLSLPSLLVLGLTALLGCCSPLFQARSDPPSIFRGYLALALGLGIVFFYTLGGFLTLYSDFEPLIDRWGLETVLLGLLSRAHLHFPRGTPAFLFARALPLLCMSAVGYGMLQLFRPVAAALLSQAGERQRVEELVRLYGQNSISYHLLVGEKSFFFADSGRAVIGFVLQGTTAVVAGDPVGPEAELPELIRQFLAFCERQDWTPVFWQVRAELAPYYRAAGLHLLKIGEDAIVELPSFSLQGGAMANLRTSARRAEKAGLTVVFYEGRVTSSEHVAQMVRISREWLQRKGGTEMGFSMSRFHPFETSPQLYAVAVDQEEAVQAFVSFVPIYGRRGWALDLMRRSSQAVPGTMELLLTRSLFFLKEQGAEVVSLGLAPLSNCNQEEDETLLAASISFLKGRLSGLTGGPSLLAFKKKFQPRWESRYLVYPETLSLPKVGLALYRVHQHDGSLMLALLRSLRPLLRPQGVPALKRGSA
ncbi:bifunctional lysylphosphatidylglycerol flippase/synthetase MprF [Thermogemmatispora onikobensis]|uniref:bifunctional lysylphosphatidylglycerol flippase/synthetase MprF n=1 Tax=Thermogemmatispora onikobensis TaxID=732234 RepID=UPI0008535B07|nr:phosphatidylglycerol lysyltransferase domain-containing protein [Thermogemmatispora onikobensis]